ncbi:hypothetical protein [Pseudosulfitobacter sp. DSM 107133]|uniref:hypothetical protein n=1 Tax=Pseudosulfitobacter sp. DSM 107133 TaxID=2883100 RepID=UPI0013B44108|nr:hypothetical protein [Pseudosulfitobacter sp. DSM 107133]UOA27882.1 hypothetical protein DSM107133_02621 [Pseudosulfitobacter sp. DSM 107133]
MTNFGVKFEDFPTVDASRSVTWAPIICNPKDASWERFVVGVVAISDDGFHIEAANRLSRLACLYEGRARSVVLSVEIAISWLTEFLASGTASLEQLDFPVGNISIGETHSVTGISCKEVSQLWMETLSSFYEVPKSQAVDTAVSVVEYALREVDELKLRLPVQVLGIVERENSSLLRFFHEDVRNRRTRRRRANARIKIDYDGKILSANIDDFNIDAPSPSVGIMKQRMWDLAVQRDKTPAEALKSRRFEMLVGFPKHRVFEKKPKSVERIQEHLRELTAQADREEIRLRTLTGPREIGEHIVRLESAE